MTLTTPPSSVAIIGAGLAGLTLALALHDRNIQATIYEARSEDFDQGGGMMLSPNALRVLDSIGVYQRVRPKALEFDILTFKDAQGTTTDQYYFGSSKIYDYQAIRIMRKELLDEMKVILKERNIPIHHNKKLTGLNSENPDLVQLTFNDGETISAPIVIGADGIHSTVRSTFMPQVKPMFAGFMGVNCTVSRSKLRIPEGYELPATVMAKPGAFLLVPQKHDGSELFIGMQKRFEELDEAGWNALRNDKQKLHDMITSTKADWPDIVQSAIEAMPVEEMGFWAFYGIPPLPSWLNDKGNIILVGDAAHAIPPTAGQGANQAFEDVQALATLLASLSPAVSLKDATAKWQTYRQDRVNKVLELTKQMNAKRLPESERAKAPPGAFWTDAGLTRGDGGELAWLYKPDLRIEAERWVEEIKNGK